MALRHVVLTVLARGELTGYEIAKNFESVYSHLWQASHQQVYKELARLHAEHGVSVKIVAQRARPDKKVYTITPSGLEELREWVISPTDSLPARFDFLVKLLAHHVADRKVFEAECGRMLASTRQWLETLRAMRKECLKAREKGWSEQDEVLYLALRRGLLFAETQVRWLKEVEQFVKHRKIPH